jgi:hypothetical protein
LVSPTITPRRVPDPVILTDTDIIHEVNDIEHVDTSVSGVFNALPDENYYHEECNVVEMHDYGGYSDE